MAKNDVILLDSVFTKTKSTYSSYLVDSQHFELFCFEQILKDYDLSQEEIEFCWVDGKDDGGIDGFFCFLDGNILTEVADFKNVRKQPELDVVIITCKHAATFEQVPINNLVASLPELFDLTKEPGNLISAFNQDLIEVRDLFCETYKELAIKQPRLNIRIIYASRGDSSIIAENINRRTEYLKESLKELFSNCQVVVDFVGATELLTMCRRIQSFSLRLKFIESHISRTHSNCIVLSKLSDFYRFITDEEGNLRRYLFESNVRDYAGSTGVNQAISDTLGNALPASELDFWWLNNGVTIIASSANIAGKEISLENIHIVNGLQTTETIFRYFKELEPTEDERAVLIKILVTQDEVVRDKIIKATNSQTPVDIASLRATDRIQRDIEHILLDHGWFYDRRRNLHRNQGRPQKQIISISYLAAVIKTLALKDPADGATQKTRFMRDDAQYDQVFNSKWDIAVFLVALEFVKVIEVLMQKNSMSYKHSGKYTIARRMWIAFVIACRQLGTIHYGPNMLVRLKPNEITLLNISSANKFMNVLENEYALQKKGGKPQISLLNFAKEKLREELEQEELSISDIP